MTLNKGSLDCKEKTLKKVQVGRNCYKKTSQCHRPRDQSTVTDLGKWNPFFSVTLLFLSGVVEDLMHMVLPSYVFIPCPVTLKPLPTLTLGLVICFTLVHRILACMI